MSVIYIVAHENKEVLNTNYFVEQLQKKWADVKIHFYSDSSGSKLQFDISQKSSILGRFSGTGISYQAHSDEDTAQFALWYRSIVPAEWRLRFYCTGLYFDLMVITPETTAEQIVAGFDIPFDDSKYE
jgi:hypothetical protein